MDELNKRFQNAEAQQTCFAFGYKPKDQSHFCYMKTLAEFTGVIVEDVIGAGCGDFDVDFKIVDQEWWDELPEFEGW